MFAHLKYSPHICSALKTWLYVNLVGHRLIVHLANVGFFYAHRYHFREVTKMIPYTKRI